MICPHCKNDTEQSAQHAVLSMKPMKVKDLRITEWCVACKKPKGWSGSLAFGDVAADPAYVDVPEMCSCAFLQPACYPYAGLVGSTQSQVITLNI